MRNHHSPLRQKTGPPANEALLLWSLGGIVTLMGIIFVTLFVLVLSAPVRNDIPVTGQTTGIRSEPGEAKFLKEGK